MEIFVLLLAFCLVRKWQAGNDYVENKVVRCNSGSHQKIEAHDFMQLIPCEVLTDKFRPCCMISSYSRVPRVSPSPLNFLRATNDYNYAMCWLKRAVKNKSAADKVRTSSDRECKNILIYGPVFPPLSSQ